MKKVGQPTFFINKTDSNFIFGNKRGFLQTV